MSAHRRWNPLQKSWVLVSPHRTDRPWLGEITATPSDNSGSYLETCYLCPTNSRSGGHQNPDYKSVFVFDNDFPALVPEDDGEANDELNGVIKSSSERGICRVLCYSPIHNATLGELTSDGILAVINEWERQYHDLGGKDFIKHVLIFENKGEMMGTSNPHPHGQIWATEDIPGCAERNARSQQEHFENFSRSLLNEYLNWELSKRERIVSESEHWATIVPYWAVWPFEVMVLPKRPVATISELSDTEKLDWAVTLKRTIRVYDELFKAPFPFSMGIYQRPTDGNPWPGFVLTQTFLPPLLRSATIRKYMVGYELFAEPQRDLTPERAAEKLRLAAANIAHEL